MPLLRIEVFTMSYMHFPLFTLICFVTVVSIPVSSVPVSAEESSQTNGSAYGLTNASLKAQEERLLNLLAAETADRVPKVDSKAPSLPEPAPSTELHVEEAIAAARALVPSPEDTERQRELSKTVKNQQETIESLTRSKLSLEKRLRAAESKLTDVLKEVERTREDLLLAETEVERLSYVIEKRNRDKIHTIQSRSTRYVAPVAAKSEVVHNEAVPLLTDNAPSQGGSREQISIATVTAQKANLRTGPGLNNSVLLTISRGSRLVVESRQGDWYRVIAPTGERAWISGTIIHFGENASGHPNSILRIKGVSSSSPHQE